MIERMTQLAERLATSLSRREFVGRAARLAGATAVALGGVCLATSKAWAGGTTMHSAFIHVGLAHLTGSRGQFFAEVTVKDDLGNLVSSAVVTGDWSGCDIKTPTTSGTTDSNGYVKILGPTVTRQQCFASGTACTETFTVTNISKTGLTYDPGANVSTYGTGGCYL